MSEQGEPLPAGVSVGDCVIQRALDQDRFGFRYQAESTTHGSVIVHELFPREFARRGADGVHLEPFDAEDRVALRWWTRNYLERARQFAALDHPSLLPVLSAFESHGTAVHATASPGAASLQSLLERHAGLDRTQLERLLADMVGALGAVHEARLLHRALSPQLILARDDGNFAIGGFGSLRAPLRFHTRMLQSVMQGPYAAPEENQADVTLTPAADLYAAAAIVWHAVAGRPPPSAEARARGAQLPPLAALAAGRARDTTLAAIEHALAFDPADRPQSVEAWSRLLRTDGTSPSPRQAAATAARPEPRRSAWLATAVPVLLVLGAGLWWALRPDGPAAAPESTTAGAAATSAAQAGGSILAASLPEPTVAAEPAPARVVDGAPAPVSQAVVEAAAGTEATAAPTVAVAVQATAAPRPAVVSTPVPTPQRRASVPAPATLQPAPTPGPRARPPAEAPGRTQGVEVASLARPSLSTPDPAAEARSEAERKRQEHAQQLALERSRCSRNGHVSELFAGRDFTYADIARFKDVTRLADGQLQTPVMRVDDGRRYAFQLDTNGCIVRILR